jgi:alginate export protein
MRIGAAVCIGLTVGTMVIGSVRAADPPAEAASLSEAIGGGKFLLNLRPRWEHVEQANKPEDADAYTMRTLFGWRTLPWRGLSLTVEGINVGHLGDRHYALSTSDPLFAQYPVVADPDITDFNQLYVDYTGLSNTLARGGRQSIKLDNVRFIGNVEFRQVMQVFNAVTVENTSLPNTRLYAGYLMRVRTVNATQLGTNTPIFNARYTWKPGNDAIAYAYLQDQASDGQNLNNSATNKGFVDNSNEIFGVRFNGGYPLGEKLKLLYTAEYAKQNNYSGGDPRIDAEYLHLGIGPQIGDWWVRADYELLGSNNGRYGFQTPLGTNHLFQGWADQFLTTPAQGIRDAYLNVSGKVLKLGIYAEAHKFKSDFGNIDFGHEFDVGLTYPLYKGLTGKIEYADYQAGDKVPGDTLANKVDVRKFWLTLIYQY